MQQNAIILFIWKKRLKLFWKSKFNFSRPGRPALKWGGFIFLASSASKTFQVLKAWKVYKFQAVIVFHVSKKTVIFTNLIYSEAFCKIYLTCIAQ